MAFQTKITQLLDAHQIAYRLLPHSQPVFTVDAAAQQRGVIKEEIQAVTGCVQGAVAPLALPESVPVILDEAVVLRKKVNISSGDPMAGLELDPQDLVRVAGGRLAPITKAGG
jgi:prolyl-tRNA editing enzyme YbaK/EbsC (Cys-tRNA(Pro) deacylase)